MGVDQSAYQQPLYPQKFRICATESRYCLPYNVQIRLRQNFFSYSRENFKITDASNSSIIYFQCNDRSSSSNGKKVLRDNMGVPILNMKSKFFRLVDKFTIFAGEGKEKEICKLNATLSFVEAKLSTIFPDILNGTTRSLILIGDWWEKRCIIYLGEPKQGGIPIARVFRRLHGPHFLAGDDYFLEIAAGVDIAICVIMCIAIDEHCNDR